MHRFVAILRRNQQILADGTVQLSIDDEARWIFLGYRRLVCVPVRVSNVMREVGMASIRVLPHSWIGHDVPPMHSMQTVALSSLFFTVDEQLFAKGFRARWMHYGIGRVVNVPVSVLSVGSDVVRIQVLSHRDREVDAPAVGSIRNASKTNLFLPVS